MVQLPLESVVVRESGEYEMSWMTSTFGGPVPETATDPASTVAPSTGEAMTRTEATSAFVGTGVTYTTWGVGAAPALQPPITDAMSRNAAMGTARVEGKVLPDMLLGRPEFGSARDGSRVSGGWDLLAIA